MMMHNPRAKQDIKLDLSSIFQQLITAVLSLQEFEGSPLDVKA